MWVIAACWFGSWCVHVGEWSLDNMWLHFLEYACGFLQLVYVVLGVCMWVLEGACLSGSWGVSVGDCRLSLR